MRTFANPTQYPAVWHFRAGSLEFDILVADEVAWVAMKMNARVADGPALKALKSQRPNGITAEDVKSSLQAEAHFRAPLQNEPDGGSEICTACGIQKQPIKYMAKDAEGQPEERGNFLELKAEKLDALKSEHPELIEAAKSLTSKIVGGKENLPKFALAIFVCEDCKRAERRGKVFRTYYSREGVLGRLGERETRIRAAVRRNTLTNLLGSKSKDPRARREFMSRWGSNDRRGGDRRPAPEKAEFEGALFHKATAEALNKAKAADPNFDLAKVAEMTIEQLVGIGALRSVEQVNAAAAIVSIAKSALERVSKTEAIGKAANEEGLDLSVVRHGKPAGKHTGRHGARFQKKG